MPVVAPVSMTMLQIVPRSVAVSPATPSPKNSKITPAAAADVAPPQQLEHDVLRLHPGLQPAAQLDARDPRALEHVRPARHRHRHLGRARADREHPERPAMVVWLSAPSSTWPGRAKRSRWR